MIPSRGVEDRHGRIFARKCKVFCPSGSFVWGLGRLRARLGQWERPDRRSAAPRQKIGEEGPDKESGAQGEKNQEKDPIGAGAKEGRSLPSPHFLPAAGNRSHARGADVLNSEEAHSEAQGNEKSLYHIAVDRKSVV